jgi:hypothetical protein
MTSTNKDENQLGFTREGGWYKTRGGDKVWAQIVGWDDFPGQPVMSLTSDLRRFYHEIDGRLLNGLTTPFDIIAPWREPAEIKGWVNVYPYTMSRCHKTRDEADRSAMADRLACVYVSGVEGVEPEED